MNNRHNRDYIPGLDGLRAIAILFVVAYHFSFSWAGGGFLGVDIFFVLSSYLITNKFITLYENRQALNIKKFWIERIRRLLPAAYTMIVTTIMWVMFYNHELLNKIWGDAASSVFYTTNWWFIFHKLSYFDSFSYPSPLKHLWFLAVQEQYFFLWPMVLIMGLKAYKKRSNFSSKVFILALCSALLMGILYNPEKDPSRIYYGTDTRCFELLIGSWLAMVLPMKKFSPKKFSVKQKNRLNIISIISLAVFIFSAIYIDEYNTFLYRGGIFLFSLNTAILIVCVCHPSSIIGHILLCKPLRWIGTRSYGIYLWHYPIMVLSSPVYEIGNPSYWRVGLQLIITCIISELSYNFIETPIRKLGLREFCRKYLSLSTFKFKPIALVKNFSVVIAISAAAVIVISTIRVAKGEREVKLSEYHPNKIILSNTEQVFLSKDYNTSYNEEDSANLDENNEVVSKEKDELSNVEKNNEKFPINNDTNPPAINKSYTEILAIGDSIIMDIEHKLKNKFTNIIVDGKISRQVADAVKLAPAYAEFNNSGKAVIIQLGTNGYFTNKKIDSLLDFFSKADIYLINTRVPRSWEKKVNKVIKEKAEERENVTLVDWYSTSVKHPEYFAGDGVHLMPKGAEALINLISEAISTK